MTYLSKIEDIYNQLAQGKALDAFETYYAENIDMIMEDGAVISGKDVNRQREIDFFSSVESFNGMEIKAINANEEARTTSVESVMDVTFNGGNRMVINQVATQKWEGDHIVVERFYGTK